MSSVFSSNILAGKVAYVAGGTRGMNLAIAKRYAAQGAAVAVMSRNPERVDHAVGEIAELGGEVRGFAADARDYDRVLETMEQTAAELGNIDIVVAGQAGNFYAPVAGMSSKGFRTVIDIDLIGTFNVFRACYDVITKPGASLIAISAPEAVKPLHFQAHVCAAKAGVNMLCKCLALEWGPQGVRVNAISPGPIEDSWGMMNVASPSQEIRDKITQALPLRRWGKVDDIANTALFLASDASSYITGTIIDTDGGVLVASPESAAAGDDDPRLRRRPKAT